MDRYRWAEIRDGLITIEVSAADGRSRRSRTRDRASGALRPVRRGVDAVGGSPPTWRQAVRAVVLAAGDDVAISHETALRLLGGARLVDQIHVLTPLGRQVRLAGVVTHRSGVIEDGDVVVRFGIPCTSPLRTIIDLSGYLNEEQLGRAVDDLLRRKALRLDDLRGRVNRTRPAPGRSVRRLRAVLAARIPGYDPGESELEGRIMRLIDAAALPRPVQQYRVDFDAHRYRLDFAWPDRKVFLEGNGFGAHSIATDLDRDARRRNALVLDGWTAIELTWRMPDAEMLATLTRALTLGTPRLTDRAPQRRTSEQTLGGGVRRVTTRAPLRRTRAQTPGGGRVGG